MAIGDSIFKTADFREINKQLGTNIKLVSGYRPTYNQKSKFQWSREQNVEAVLENELNKANYKQVILGLPSIPITDLPGDDVEDPFLKQEASKSSYDMLKIAEKTLKYYEVREIFLVERAPRHDTKRALSEFANSEMHRLLQQSQYKGQIKILKHTLECPAGKSRDSVYGSPQTHTDYDGYHMRADKLKSGKDRAATKSLIIAFRSIGLQNTVPKPQTMKNPKNEEIKKPNVADMHEKNPKNEVQQNPPKIKEVMNNEANICVKTYNHNKKKCPVSLPRDSSNTAWVEKKKEKRKEKFTEKPMAENNKDQTNKPKGHDELKDKQIKVPPIDDDNQPRMRGGAGGAYIHEEMVNKAIASAWRQNKIELEHGSPNPGVGNCAFESVIYNINDREVFQQKVNMSPLDARRMWVTELQTAIEAYYPNEIPDNIPGFNAQESWDKIKEEGVYEIDLMGDLMLHAISRGCKKVLLIINTSINAQAPIYVMVPERFGGVRDSEVPVCVAYNQSHYESMHPKYQKDIELTQELVQQYTAVPPTYQYFKKDIERLIKPLEEVTDAPTDESLSQSNVENPPRKQKQTKTAAERKRESRQNPDQRAKENEAKAKKRENLEQRAKDNEANKKAMTKKREP